MQGRTEFISSILGRLALSNSMRCATTLRTELRRTRRAGDLFSTRSMSLLAKTVKVSDGLGARVGRLGEALSGGRVDIRRLESNSVAFFGPVEIIFDSPTAGTSTDIDGIVLRQALRPGES